MFMLHLQELFWCGTVNSAQDIKPAAATKGSRKHYTSVKGLVNIMEIYHKEALEINGYTL